LEDGIDKKMQNVWAALLVRSVNTLEKFDALIPPIIRQHYENIVGGGSGYQGYRWVVPNVEDARWDWQLYVPCSTGRNNAGQLPIRCAGGFFVDEFVEIGEPCLWIFDYKRGAPEGMMYHHTMDYNRVWQGLTAATEVDGWHLPLEYNILATRGLVFRGEDAGRRLQCLEGVLGYKVCGYSSPKQCHHMSRI
jgi:hypothetical protein